MNVQKFSTLKGRIVQPPKTGLKCTSAAAPTLQQTVACQSSPLRVKTMEANDIFADSYTDVHYFTHHKAESFVIIWFKIQKTTIFLTQFIS